MVPVEKHKPILRYEDNINVNLIEIDFEVINYVKNELCVPFLVVVGEYTLH